MANPDEKSEKFEKEIAGRGQAEEALIGVYDSLEDLFKYANNLVVVWDSECRIIRFSYAFEDLTGKNANEVLGEPLDILFPEDRQKETMAHIRRTTEGEMVAAIEIPVIVAEGDVKAVFWNLATLYASDGTTVAATIAHSSAHGESKPMHAQLHPVQKTESIGTPPEKVARDFNNILATIIDRIEMAMFDVPEGAPAHEDLRQAIDAGYRGKELINRIACSQSTK